MRADEPPVPARRDDARVVSPEPGMLVVGLTGGIAAGKSTVARMFAACGAAVVDADGIAHRLQEPGTAPYAAIVDAFGPEVLDPAGRIDRPWLGARVFADPTSRGRLEAILHPAIWESCTADIEQARARGHAVCIIEAALILETGQRGRFDRLVVVVAPEDVQLERLRQRGLSLEAARQRLGAQWSNAAKASAADYLIETGGILADTEAQVRRAHQDLLMHFSRQKTLDKARGPL
jgi:dephospho-CoA kinase